MKLIKLALVCAVFGGVVGCKTTEVTPPVQAHRWYDAEGNVYMEPPAPGEGIQIVIDTFEVPLGKEVQGNFFFKLPVTETLNIGKIEVALNKGTHHMNCFRTIINQTADSTTRPRSIYFTQNGKTDTTAILFQPTFYSATVWNASDMLIEAQKEEFEWTLSKLPNDTTVPVSIRGKQTTVQLKPNENMVIETHFVNASTQQTPSGKGKVIINLYKTHETDLVPASMMVARKKNLILPPNQTTVAEKVCYFSGVPSFPIWILGMTGHYHSRGKTFFVDVVNYGKNADGTLDPDPAHILPTPAAAKIYESTSWSEPPFATYATPYKVSYGQTIRYTATYINNTSTSIPFGPHVESEEHCNLFCWFVPGDGDGRTYYDDKP